MTSPTLADINRLLKNGDRRAAQRELARLLKSDPVDQEAWLLLAQLVEDPARKADCYRHVLEIDPGNKHAAEALEWLYTQPKLGMDLPQAVTPASKNETLEAADKSEGLPDQTLFDLTLNQLSSKQDTENPEEELIPLSEPILPRKKVRLKWLYISIGGFLLLVAVVLGIWKLLQPKLAIALQSQSTQITQTTQVADEITPTQMTASSGLVESTHIPTPSISNLTMRIVWSDAGTLAYQEQDLILPLTKTDSSTSKVALSPDGEFVAFNRSGGIWVINVHESNNERLLVRPVALPKDDLPQGSVTRAPDSFVWLPGSHKILFNTIYTPYTGTVQTANDLFLVDYESGKVTRLLTSGSGGAIYPSPNGKAVVVVSPNAIQIFSLASGTTTASFAYGPVISSNGGSIIPQITWDSSSNNIFAAIPPADAVSQPNTPARLWQIPIEGSEAVMLSDLHTLGGLVFISPDLKQAAYILDTSVRHNGIGEWHVCSLDGSSDTILLPGKNGIFLGWSSDGSAGAFGVSADPPEIWFYDSSTGKTWQFSSSLISGTTLTRFDWISANAFLYETKNETGSRLWYASASGQPIQLIEDSAGADIPFAGAPLP